MARKKREWLAAVVTLFVRNWVTLFGAILSGISGFLIVGFLLLGVLQLTASPYLGIMAFLVLPGVFVLGLAIIPVGAYWEHRQARKREGEGLPARQPFPCIDLNNAHTRRVAVIVIILTAVNFLIISTVTYKGVGFMESVTFCGKVCHTVMEPEHTAYVGSPHSRVPCVECHIGPGAPWFVRSKLSGMGQVIAVVLNSYEHPIPTPVENLRPSQDTCEHCHWPEKFTGDRVRVITRYLEDEENTPMKTVLIMHIGGGASDKKGIHSWHIDPRIETTYMAADPKRQEISMVRVRKADGTVVEYANEEAREGADEAAAGEMRRMDCIDCHNRPTHVFELPAEGMDVALERGRISQDIPYIKKVGTEALTNAEGKAGDLDKLATEIRGYYQEDYAEFFAARRDDIEAAIREIQGVYERNVFPDMDVTWGTYIQNIGHTNAHTNWPGCFRCHDDHLATDDGETIGQDCEVCHTVLAWDEEKPEILEQLQIQ